mgnify:CR=1 FL=1
MSKKKALITGITGQDGSYLAEFLLDKGYEVHGIKRRSSSFNTERIDHIYVDPHEADVNFYLHYGDLTESENLLRLIKKIKPDEIYNLGAQSHVAVSFEIPTYTADVNALGTLRLLEAIRALDMCNSVKFYQASSSELFGLVQEVPQRENTPFYPRSPYGVAKLFAYWITVNYRESYKMFACNGILFNHESPRRGETFVTRKISKSLASIAHGKDNCLYIGNLNATRDWGHAKDYVEMQWLMLQQDSPDDYVIASGNSISVRDFIVMTAREIGLKIEFQGEGKDEIGKVIEKNNDLSPSINVGDIIVRVDEKYFRPSEVDSLIGDASKAKSKLNWKPSIKLQDLCKEMVLSDLDKIKEKFEK